MKNYTEKYLRQASGLAQIFPWRKAVRDMDYCLGLISEEYREPCIKLLNEVNALCEERHSRGFTYWDATAATYAANIRGVKIGLEAGLDRYAEFCEKIQSGSKRYGQEHLDRVIERLIIPRLAVDLTQPQYHPIDPQKFPNPEHVAICPASGAKLSNEHAIGNTIVTLQWTYKHDEPSFWVVDNAEFNGWGISPISPKEAIQKMYADRERQLQEAEEERSKAYSLNELGGMYIHQLRRIAEARGIEVAPKGKRKVQELIGKIYQPQGSLFD